MIDFLAEALMGVIAITLVLGLWVGVPWMAARSRGHRVWPWIIVSIIFSPVIAFLLLMMMRPRSKTDD